MPTVGSRRWFSAAALLAAALTGLAGCGTLSTLDSASRVLDTYELTPLSLSGGSAGRGPVLYVAEPTGSAALQSDRIVVKPSSVQVALLPDARWVEPTPVLFQRLLRQSLVNSGRFRFVSSSATGPISEYAVVPDIEAFQVETGGGEDVSYSVSVRIGFTLIRDLDQQVVGARWFGTSVPIADDSALAVVGGFEAANQAVLRQAVDWIVASLASRGS